MVQKIERPFDGEVTNSKSVTGAMHTHYREKFDGEVTNSKPVTGAMRTLTTERSLMVR